MTDARAALAALLSGPAAREIDEDILDITTSPPRAHYDLTAPVYDVLVGSAIWHKTLWRTRTAAFRTFASTIFGARTTGPHIELGCGSLLFTAHLYDEDRGRPAILIDQSIQMLRQARRRLRARLGAVPSHVALVRADARDLRMARGHAGTVLAMHVLHVVRERGALLRVLGKLARPAESTIGLTSIFLAGGRGDVFLRLLSAAGELAPGVTLPELEGLVAEHLPGRARRGGGKHGIYHRDPTAPLTSDGRTWGQHLDGGSVEIAPRRRDCTGLLRRGGTPSEHAVRARRSSTPFEHAVRARRSSTPFEHAVRARRSSTPFEHALRARCSSTLFEHAVRARCSSTLFRTVRGVLVCTGWLRRGGECPA